jgi:hypothetical protein
LEALAADAGLSSAVLGELLRRRDVLRAADGAASAILSVHRALAVQTTMPRLGAAQ